MFLRKFDNVEWLNKEEIQKYLDMIWNDDEWLSIKIWMYVDLVTIVINNSNERKQNPTIKELTYADQWEW